MFPSCLLTKFELENEHYHYINVSDFLKHNISYEVNTVGRTGILNVGLSFDIETTKVGDYSFMYVWQFAIDEYTVIGRTWDDFLAFLKKLSRMLELGENRKAIVWVHNHSFEFSFYKMEVEFDKTKYGQSSIFAISDRKVLTSDIYGFHFADSLAITNKKLADVAKDYHVGIEKLNGNLNYSLNISPDTPLKLCQLAYCINDVQILSRWFHCYIKPNFLRMGKKVPITSTGIVRNDMKVRFKKLTKAEKENYHRMIRRSYPSKYQYEDIMQWLYRGGYVHSNAYLSGIMLYNMGSCDLKSSYPASLLHNKYPYRFIQKDKSYFYKIMNNRRWQKDNAFYGCFTFTNIRTKTSHTLESSNKIIHAVNPVYDNGRLASADSITVALTEVDWQIYQLYYIWDGMPDCENIFISSKRELPKFLKDLILDYYITKETTPKHLIDYMLNKFKLNSIYGMMVTSIYDKTLRFNEETGLFQGIPKDKEWDDLIKNELLLPYWGIWCTAYSRYVVASTMIKVGSLDGSYGDTDSIKFKNVWSNMYIFDNYNDRMERINKTMYVGNHDRRFFINLGKWDFEGKMYKMCTQGAKRYIHTDIVKCKDGKYRLKDITTIAGLPKMALPELADKEGKDIYELFTDGMTVHEMDSHKMTTKYIDTPFSIDSMDYLGKSYHVDVKSCVTLLDIPFKMTIKDDYIRFRYNLQKQNKYRVGVRNE